MCRVGGVGAEDMAAEEGTEERDEDEDAADDNVALALDLEQVVGAEGVVTAKGVERNAQPVREGTSTRRKEC